MRALVPGKTGEIARYAHVYPRTLALTVGGAINVKPLTTDGFSFEDGVRVFDFATRVPPNRSRHR